MQEKIGIPGLQTLIDRLMSRNKEATRLLLQSAPDDRYVVDYEGKYSKYFEPDGGGWAEWHRQYPDARGMVTVSIPAFDGERNNVLVYFGIESGDTNGSGFILAYQHKGTVALEIDRALLWVS